MQVNSLIFLGFLFLFYLLIIIVYFIIIAYCSLVIRIALGTHIVQDVLEMERELRDTSVDPGVLYPFHLRSWMWPGSLPHPALSSVDREVLSFLHFG